MYDWVKAKEMFPKGCVATPEGNLSLVDLPNYPFVDCYVALPSRQTMNKIERLRYFYNGDMRRDCVFSALPYDGPDNGFSPLNLYFYRFFKEANE